jgi:nickel transport protein
VTRAAAIAVLAWGVVAAPAWAHALGATVRVRDGRLTVEAYFADNTPARDARVTVFDSSDNQLADGRTDDDGRWGVAAPPAGSYRVVVDAGGGHRVRKTITVPAAAGETVSEGPPREEFTRFPWPAVAAGLAIIGGLAVGWRAWRRSPHRGAA